MRNILAVFGIIGILTICTYLGYEVVRMDALVDAGAKMSLSAEKYERPVDNKREILILGDSLAYGVGVDEPVDSFAGVLASRLGSKSINNNAEIGETIGSLEQTLDSKLNHRYEHVYIIVGGNDIMRMHINIFASKNSLRTLIMRASQQADRVTLITTGNFTDVSLSPWILSRVFEARANLLRDTALILESEVDNFDYVDFQAAGIESQEYKRFEAPDGFHLNKEGINKLVSVMLDEKN